MKIHGTIGYLDGQWVDNTLANTGLYAQTMHYGVGVFEGIRAYQTGHGPRIFKAKDHFERLLFSAEAMHIPFNMSLSQLEAVAYELLERNGLKDAYIRPLIFLGPNMSLHVKPDDVHFFMCAWEWGNYFDDKLQAVKISPYQRPNPKSCVMEAKVNGHYVNSALATMDAKQSGYDEALLCDMNGYVAEGPGANFFYEQDNQLFTCPVGSILRGITRATILELANALGISVEERFFTPQAVEGADGAFFTGTAAEVTGIESINKIPFKKAWKDTLGYQLSKAYQQLVREEKITQAVPAI